MDNITPKTPAINEITGNSILTMLTCRPTHDAVVDYLCKNPDKMPEDGCVEIAFDCGYAVTVTANQSLRKEREQDIANRYLYREKGSFKGRLHEFSIGTYLEDLESSRLCFIDRAMHLCDYGKTCEVWMKYIPKVVNLYNVNYTDDLSGHMDLLQRCVENNNLYAIYENVYDWWTFPAEYDMSNIRKEMREDSWEEEYEKNEIEIQEWLEDHDTSDPVGDLIGNTGDLTCYYSLAIEVDGWHTAFMCTPWRGETEASAAYKVRRALRIPKDSQNGNIIKSIIENAGGGGELRIYFTAPLHELLCDNGDFTSIIFKGKFYVGVINSGEGSGDFEPMELNLTLPFKRENISISQADKYSLEEVFGMCSDWCKSDPIQFGTAPINSKRKIPTSKMRAIREKEAKYNETFKSGSCTFGDMDMSRHRDVYYDNNVPCGNKCPHCGTFWID